MFSVLLINAGSSSLKVTGYAAEQPKLAIEITGLGQSETTCTVSPAGQEKTSRQQNITNHEAALQVAIEEVQKVGSLDNLEAVGHRIVHGGPDHIDPVIIDDAVFRDLAEFQVFDPDHLPVALGLVETAQSYLPAVAQVACFDTAFFAELPLVSQLLALPQRYREEGLRRYGFHGLSYTSLRRSFREAAGEAAMQGRVIYAHLGSGVSLTATYQGKPVDTTMGFSPTSGVIMSSRSGDIDPSVVQFLHTKHHISYEHFSHLVNFEAGLLGVSGLSADMYTLLQREDDHEGAANAVELFVHQVKKAIGSLAATMNGVDSLIFAGGIGEKSSDLRWRICDGLQFLGIKLDSVRNDAHQQLISADDSRAGVHVFASDEASAMFEMVTKTIQEGVK